MNRILLFGLLLLTISFSHAQKVFQAGNHKGQSQRAYLTLEGTLLEKYQNKGYNWFALQKENEVCYISIVNQELFDRTAITEKIKLSDCFKLDSRRWKRKNQKKVEILASSNK